MNTSITLQWSKALFRRITAAPEFVLEALEIISADRGNAHAYPVDCVSACNVAILWLNGWSWFLV